MKDSPVNRYLPCIGSDGKLKWFLKDISQLSIWDQCQPRRKLQVKYGSIVKCSLPCLSKSFLLRLIFPPVSQNRSIWREIKTLYLLISICFFSTIHLFDFKEEFKTISSNCSVEKRKDSTRLQMCSLSLG